MPGARPAHMHDITKAPRSFHRGAFVICLSCLSVVLDRQDQVMLAAPHLPRCTGHALGLLDGIAVLGDSRCGVGLLLHGTLPGLRMTQARRLVTRLCRALCSATCRERTTRPD